MAHRDLKRSAQFRKASPKAGGGMLTGIVIGLIIGVIVAVGLAMFLSRSSTPFSNLERLDRRTSNASAPTEELLAPGTRITDMLLDRSNNTSGMKRQQAASQTNEATSSGVSSLPESTTATEPKEDQRFDFYKILPGQADALTKENTNQPASSTSPLQVQKIYIQLGVFQNQDEADNLKAKLALLGIEANIQSVNLPEKGLVHRVRLGPYSNRDDVIRIRAQLKREGVGAIVIN